METPATGTIHHVELWVPDLPRAVGSWGWLLGELGYEPFQQWPEGQSWRAGATYIVIEQSPARTAFRHDRCRPGLNHLAFHVQTTERVDELTAAASRHGWRLMFADLHPYAGGDQHYAAYLENSDGFEVELVGSTFWPDSAGSDDPIWSGSAGSDDPIWSGAGLGPGAGPETGPGPDGPAAPSQPEP